MPPAACDRAVMIARGCRMCKRDPLLTKERRVSLTSSEPGRHSDGCVGHSSCEVEPCREAVATGFSIEPLARSPASLPRGVMFRGPVHDPKRRRRHRHRYHAVPPQLLVQARQVGGLGRGSFLRPIPSNLALQQLCSRRFLTVICVKGLRVPRESEVLVDALKLAGPFLRRSASA